MAFRVPKIDRHPGIVSTPNVVIELHGNFFQRDGSEGIERSAIFFRAVSREKSKSVIGMQNNRKAVEQHPNTLARFESERFAGAGGNEGA